MFSNRMVAVALSALGLCAAAGCKFGNKGARVKDLEATGESSSGNSNLSLYPVKGQNGSALIQSVRCVVGVLECEFRCALQSDVVAALNGKGQDGQAVVDKISETKKSTSDDPGLFKDLEQVVLDKKISSKCDARFPYHPGDKPKEVKVDSKRSKMDLADSYLLQKDGAFYRNIGDERCVIGADVEDFKIAENPSDSTFAYFIKAGGLWFVSGLSAGEETFKADSGVKCPKLNVRMILPDIAKVGSTYQYFVMPENKATIVNIGLRADGDFVAWDNAGPVLEEQNVAEVEMNPCFGTGRVEGLDNFMALLKKHDDSLVKIKGTLNQDEGKGSLNFTSINDFRTKIKGCPQK